MAHVSTCETVSDSSGSRLCPMPTLVRELTWSADVVFHPYCRFYRRFIEWISRCIFLVDMCVLVN